MKSARAGAPSRRLVVGTVLQQLDGHSVSRPAPGVLLITLRGLVEARHVHAMLDLFDELDARDEPVAAIISDFRQISRFSSGARRARSQRRSALNHRDPAPRHVVITESVMKRAIAKLLFNAIRLTTLRKDLDFRFFGDADEAFEHALQPAEPQLQRASTRT